MKEKTRLVITTLMLVFVVNSFYSCQNRKVEKTEKNAADTVVLVEPLIKYGLPVDSFHVYTGVVKSNQYLSQILNSNGVGMGTIDAIAKKSRSVFDVRKIKSGQNFTILSTKDSVAEPRYFIYGLINTPSII